MISPPEGEEDVEGARRFLEEFLILYQPVLIRVEHHLEKLIQDAGPYADAYRPWRKAVHQVFRGVYLLAKGIPVPDLDSFIDAVRMFSFDSAAQLIGDLCISSKMALKNDWAERFREHINQLLLVINIIIRGQQVSLNR